MTSRSLLLVRLRPLSPFHLGTRGVGLEQTETFVRSDTLFGALCSAWVRCHGRQSLEVRLLHPSVKQGSPVVPLRLSSAYPFARDALLLPRPLSPIGVSGAEEPWQFRRGRFLSYELFQAAANGERIEAPRLWQGGDCWLAASEAEGLLQVATTQAGRRVTPEEAWIWSEQEVPRVAQDRVGQATSIFHCSRVTFADGCGLYFMADVVTDLRELLESAFRVLGDTGIGGDRTAGYGQFVPAFEEFELAEAEGAEHFVTLSLLAPRQGEIQEMMDERSAYELVRRDGWIDSPEARNYRRRSCRMFTEGSVFRGDARRVWGRLVDVTPMGEGVTLSHPVYRYGIGFAVPIRIQQEGV